MNPKNRNRYLTYALVAAGVGVGAVWAGVPVSTVVLLGLLLTCPLMMIFMHGGHGGGQGGHGGHGGPARDAHTGHSPGADRG
jgi:hypothetical protein